MQTSPIDPNFQSDPKATEVKFIDTGQQNWKIHMRSHTWRPPTDIYENQEALVVRVEIAGMQENDFEIAISEKKLSIQGIRADTGEKRAYHQMEIHYGEFSVEIDLPFPVQSEKTEALYRNGFLHIWLPKELPRQIPFRD